MGWKKFRLRKKVFVQNGIDIRQQMPGHGKGEYFAGNTANIGTVLVNGQVRPGWTIVFYNLATRERSQYHFAGQMTIGRAADADETHVKMVIPGDGEISKNHCMIYEYEGKLCVADLNSKNHTYLNGVRLDAPAFLATGDMIRVGKKEFRVDFGK